MAEENKNGNGGENGGGNPDANIEMQREIDKAVTKALATQKNKLDKEYVEKLTGLQGKLDAFETNGLTDAEKVAKQLKAAEEAEKTYTGKLKRLEIGKEFAAMGMTEEEYSPVIDDYLKGDFKTATSKMAALIEKKANERAETKFKTLAANIPDVKTGKDGKTWTKDSFAKLTYSEQMAEISKNPELVKLI